MTVSLIVPYRPVGLERPRNWAWCQARWETLLPDAKLVVCDSGDDPFNRGRSINQGVERSEGDLLIIADADTAISDVADLLALATTGAWVIGYDWYYTLQPEPTGRLLAYDPADPLPDPAVLGCTDPDRVRSVSGVLAMPREAFEQAGGFEEGWRGWGCDDRAFAIVMDKEWGHHARVDGWALHLWHPRGLDFQSPDWPHNAALLERYREWELGTPGFFDPRAGTGRPVG